MSNPSLGETSEGTVFLERLHLLEICGWISVQHLNIKHIKNM